MARKCTSCRASRACAGLRRGAPAARPALSLPLLLPLLLLLLLVVMMEV